MGIKPIRPIRIEGNAAYIPLTQGYEAIIDVSDVPLVADMHWRAHVAYLPCGGVKAVYARTGFAKNNILLHRLLMPQAGELLVDHIDRNGLNNRRSNLRVATNAQNQHNAAIRRTNKSGRKGVRRHESDKWVAEITSNGRRVYLGLFSDRDDAAATYAAASADLHGSFSRTT